MNRCLVHFEPATTIDDIRAYVLYDEHIANTRPPLSRKTYRITRMVRVGAQIANGKLIIGGELPHKRAMYKDLTARQFDSAAGVFIDPSRVHMVNRLKDYESMFNGEISCPAAAPLVLPKFYVGLRNGNLPPYIIRMLDPIIRDILAGREEIPQELVPTVTRNSGTVSIANNETTVSVAVDTEEYLFSNNVEILVKDGQQVAIGDQLARVYPRTSFPDYGSMITTIGLELYHELADIAFQIQAKTINGFEVYPIDFVQLSEISANDAIIIPDFTNVPEFQFFEFRNSDELIRDMGNVVVDFYNNPYRKGKTERLIAKRETQAQAVEQQLKRASVSRSVDLRLVKPLEEVGSMENTEFEVKKTDSQEVEQNQENLEPTLV